MWSHDHQMDLEADVQNFCHSLENNASETVPSKCLAEYWQSGGSLVLLRIESGNLVGGQPRIPVSAVFVLHTRSRICSSTSKSTCATRKPSEPLHFVLLSE
jgi:hypothetical protein